MVNALLNSQDGRSLSMEKKVLDSPKKFSISSGNDNSESTSDITRLSVLYSPNMLRGVEGVIGRAAHMKALSSAWIDAALHAKKHWFS